MFKNVPKEKISAKKKLYENSKIVKMKIRWQYFVQYFFFFPRISALQTLVNKQKLLQLHVAMKVVKVILAQRVMI